MAWESHTFVAVITPKNPPISSKKKKKKIKKKKKKKRKFVVHLNRHLR
jgi:hypothetical protein